VTPTGLPRAAGRPRVCVVSDVRLFREGLFASLSGQTGIDVVGTGCAAEAHDLVLVLRPDALLLDLAARDSLALPRSLVALLPSLRVVAFAVTEAETDVLACAEAGISGYVAQDGSVEDLVGTVLHAVDGELVCPPRIAALLFQRVAALSVQAPSGPSEPLTPREREIAGLVARGLPNKAIARELRLAPATIKNHVHNILQKLSLQRRGEIAARQSGRRAPG
jgi:DNA-binding NarL/FixJ family response regulator